MLSINELSVFSICKTISALSRISSSVFNQQFVESLQDLTRECEFALSEKERREREARDRFTFTEPEQCSLNVDPNTGEVVEGSEVAET